MVGFLASAEMYDINIHDERNAIQNVRHATYNKSKQEAMIREYVTPLALLSDRRGTFVKR